jgi:hypothetical protein
MSRPIINVSELEFRTAIKTKPIRAKPVQSVVPDPTVLRHLRLTTLEGPQALKPNGWICQGGNGELWQQSAKKLAEKYEFGDSDEGGWITLSPRAGQSVNAAAVDGAEGGFAVRGRWGDEQPNGDLLQYGADGDYVLQSTTDPDDVWIVKRHLFEATYDFAT